MKSIVTIGGGTGQFTLLSGLKKFPVALTAIVSMADDGGSTGILRDELGVLPPGDVRQCLTALSEADGIVRELFSYRFDAGSLKGHSFGNIFLSALEKVTGSFEEAVRVSAQVLATRGSVIPVTTQNARLVCEAQGIAALHGEHLIDVSVVPKGASLRFESDVYANPKALEAIAQADAVIIGPGGLYDSILPNLIVKGLPEAIARSRAKVIYNCNLMNKPGHADGFCVGDYVEAIERHIGAGRIECVTYNDRMPDADVLSRYALEGEHPVAPTHEEDGRTYLAADLVSRKGASQKATDGLRRALIRHDSDALAALIVSRCL